MDGTTTTGTLGRWATRLLALLALVGVVVAVIVVVGGSLDSSGDREKKSDRGGRQEREQPQSQGEPQGETYVVQPGDSLSTIAEAANITEEELLRLNPDVDPQTLQPGQTLRLQSG